MEQHPALVSILIPAYKVESYIAKSIESALNQTYPNIEVLIVNDGSPDGTGEICDAYAKKDGRVRVIHIQNSGVSVARNTLLDNARGAYLFFLDSDDTIEADTISCLMDCIVRDGSDLACCNFLKVDENGNALPTDSGYVDAVLSPKDYLTEAYLPGRYAAASVMTCRLFKRELIGRLRFPVGKHHEDEFLSYRTAHNAKSITTIAARKYLYFQRTNSIMGKRVSAYHFDAAEAYLEKAEWCRDKGYDYLMYRALKQSCGTLAKKKLLIEPSDEKTIQHYRSLKRKFFKILLRDGIGRVPLVCFLAGAVFLVSERLLLKIADR